MAYQWSNQTITPAGKVGFTVSDGTYCLDFVGGPCGEGVNQEQAAALVGAMKDALEAANLTVGTIATWGGASWTLTEV
ncbi:hypothetical protein [Nonomuraea sp. 10N515B]|uniref:hypothetical protein n=1 Tax=Nonomuraea sp. 10N515B TaxID=3457422 RepID=UPI003FCEC1CE